MNNSPGHSSRHNIWDQNEDEFEDDDWPPPGEFRRTKLVLLAFVLGLLLAAGSWWMWSTRAPASSADNLETAQDLVGEGDYQAAVVELKRLIAETPDNGEIRWLLGNSYLQLDQPVLARPQLQAAFDLGYFEQPLLLALTRANLRDGEYEAAMKLAREWSDADSVEASAEWQMLYGQALLKLGRRAQAMSAFARVLQLDAENPEARRTLAYTGIGPDLGTWVGNDIDEALSIGLDQPETWLLKGELALSQEQFEQALACFEKARELDSDNAYALSGLARVLMASNQLDAASEPVRALAQRFPSDAAGAYVRAVYANAHGEHQQVLDALKIVFRQDRNHAASLLLQGETQQATGDHEQAVASLRRYHRLEPDNPVGRKLFAEALLESGQPERALELLEADKDAVFKDPEYATLLARAATEAEKQSAE